MRKVPEHLNRQNCDIIRRHFAFIQQKMEEEKIISYDNLFWIQQMTYYYPPENTNYKYIQKAGALRKQAKIMLAYVRRNEIKKIEL